MGINPVVWDLTNCQFSLEYYFLKIGVVLFQEFRDAICHGIVEKAGDPEKSLREHKNFLCHDLKLDAMPEVDACKVRDRIDQNNYIANSEIASDS